MQQAYKKIYRQRRAERDVFMQVPRWKRFQKRIAHRFEAANKFLWTNLLGRFLGIHHREGPLDPRKIRSILFIRNDAIGDMVLTTPLWRAIRKQFPHIRIGVAASFRNRAILDHDPNVDCIFDATAGDWKAIWKARREASNDTWDVVMPMVYQDKTKIAILCRFLAPGAISTMLLKPEENVELRKKLFSIVVQSPYRTEDIEMIEQMRVHLTGVLKMQVRDAEWKPFVYLDSEAVHTVNNRLQNILEEDGTHHFIHINLEAKMAFREFGIINSFELSQKLTRAIPDTSILWTASEHTSADLLAFLEHNEHHRIHYFPTRSLHELIAFVAKASLVITPDTAVVHIASALERPIIGLYVMRREWPPYKTSYRLLTSGKDRPVSSIPVPEVVQAALELLETHPNVSF